MKKVIEELRKIIEIDMQQGRTWVVDYAVLRCKELGYCAFCGKKTKVWSTSDGCMDCFNKEFSCTFYCGSCGVVDEAKGCKHWEVKML